MDCLCDASQALVSFIFLSVLPIDNNHAGKAPARKEEFCLSIQVASTYFLYLGALTLGADMLVSTMAPSLSFNVFPCV